MATSETEKLTKIITKERIDLSTPSNYDINTLKDVIRKVLKNHKFDSIIKNELLRENLVEILTYLYIDKASKQNQIDKINTKVGEKEKLFDKETTRKARRIIYYDYESNLF